MLSTTQVDRPMAVQGGVLWLVGLAALSCLLGYLLMVSGGWLTWWPGPSAAPDPAAACPFPNCGIWFPR